MVALFLVLIITFLFLKSIKIVNFAPSKRF